MQLLGPVPKCRLHRMMFLFITRSPQKVPSMFCTKSTIASSSVVGESFEDSFNFDAEDFDFDLTGSTSPKGITW